MIFVHYSEIYCKIEYTLSLYIPINITALVYIRYTYIVVIWLFSPSFTRKVVEKLWKKSRKKRYVNNKCTKTKTFENARNLSIIFCLKSIFNNNYWGTVKILLLSFFSNFSYNMNDFLICNSYTSKRWHVSKLPF